MSLVHLSTSMDALAEHSNFEAGCEPKRCHCVCSVKRHCQLTDVNRSDIKADTYQEVFVRVVPGFRQNASRSSELYWLRPDGTI
jgi:hypothetical protein